ncbi:hypothetical protein [Ornithinimicrobium sp. W1665]|uniref:hypothetical protein n=1 Tax=Ornithinimicrobium sp. W1665 TaxID=3416666 RepID=UPI003CEA6E95
MGSPRIKGDRLSFHVDGVDHWADATSVVMDGEDLEVPDMHGEVKLIRLRSWFDVEAVQSTAAASLWTFCWEHQGQTVPFAYAPHGNPLPTEDQPHFTGVLTVPLAPRLGGSAGRTTEQTFESRFHIVQGPLRVTTTE